MYTYYVYIREDLYYIFMHEKLPNFLLLMKKIIKEIGRNHVVATGPLVTEKFTEMKKQRLVFYHTTT